MPVPAIANVVGLRYIGGNDGYRPVYLLALAGGQQCVVKGEKSQHASASASIKWGSKLMKNVASPEVNVKVLTQPEIQTFAAAGRHFLAGDRDFPTYIQFGTQIVWTKMPYIAGLSDSDVYKKGPAAADAIYDRLTKASFWEGLGRILAVDLFVGNFDRFDENGDFVNHGNLFFTDVGAGKFRVIGLDFFSARDVATGQSDLKLATDGAYGHLQILRDQTSRRQYATNVITGIQRALLKENPTATYNLMERDTWLVMLEGGIVAGANELRNYLQGKISSYARANPRQIRMGQRGAPPAVPAAAAPAGVPAPGGWARAVPAASVNNSREVTEKLVPAGVRARMRYLGWGG
jgi:hypothetical protein